MPRDVLGPVERSVGLQASMEGVDDVDNVIHVTTDLAGILRRPQSLWKALSVATAGAGPNFGFVALTTCPVGKRWILRVLSSQHTVSVATAAPAVQLSGTIGGEAGFVQLGPRGTGDFYLPYLNLLLNEGDAIGIGLSVVEAATTWFIFAMYDEEDVT